jgi:hypothetical protein
VGEGTILADVLVTILADSPNVLVPVGPRAVGPERFPFPVGPGEVFGLVSTTARV